MTILKFFEVEMYGNYLVPSRSFFKAVSQIGSNFDLLWSSAQARIETLDLRQEIGNETIDTIIIRLFNFFEKQNTLSESGGIMIASKTMHLIMPEIFIMVDSHIRESLHNVLDYKPYISDGQTWRDVIPNYSGRTANPHQSNTTL